jgi:acyl-CoA thioesterase-1
MSLLLVKERKMVSVYTFGDSMLDCGHYNAFGVNPGQLLVQNDNRLFPEFRGHDLVSLGPARLIHRAQDGATVSNLPAQVRGLPVEGESIALLTIGGNDLLSRPDMGQGAETQRFAEALESFLQSLPIRPVFLGNVYDPTFGDDSFNFLDIEPSIAQQSHRILNVVIAELARRYGALVDLHTHFLTGDPSWFAQIIEPSLRGASEIRRCFLRQVLPYVRH